METTCNGFFDVRLGAGLAVLLALVAGGASADAADTPAAPAGVAQSTTGRDGGPSGAFSYSSDPAVAATQRAAKAVVERYQAALNSGDTAAIKATFAPDAVVEINHMQTLVGSAGIEALYQQVFDKQKFSTDFQFDAVDIHGDIAIVRTHHPLGQKVLMRATGKGELDFNREVFVLQRKAGDWRIILYTFNEQPKQGEQ